MRQLQQSCHATTLAKFTLIIRNDYEIFKKNRYDYCCSIKHHQHECFGLPWFDMCRWGWLHRDL